MVLSNDIKIGCSDNDGDGEMVMKIVTVMVDFPGGGSYSLGP